MVEGAGSPAGAKPGARAGPQASTLQMRFPMLMLVRALETSMARKVEDLHIDLILCHCHLVLVQNEGQVNAGKLLEGGHGVGQCWTRAAGHGSSLQKK